MLNKIDFVKILRCPITYAKLSWVDDKGLALLDERFKKGEFNYAFSVSKITQALKAQDHDIYYLIVDDIFYLLPEFALMTMAKVHCLDEKHQKTKTEMKTFYDTIGWQQTEGVYQDARDSEDLREVSNEYITQCHLRVKQYLPQQGIYLLDIACGPIQYPAYLTYSENFNYRICADISLKALYEAKKKLAEKGLYVLCDITNLPFQENSIDAILSLHTIYHVPAKEQPKAFEELHRALKVNGTSVVVYSWGPHSILMNGFLLPIKIFSLLKKKWKQASLAPTIYFHAYSYHWFIKEIKPKYSMRLFSWRSVNVPFLKIFIHPKFCGKTFLRAIFWLENRFPSLMGRWGAYPLLVSVKK